MRFSTTSNIVAIVICATLLPAISQAVPGKITYSGRVMLDGKAANGTLQVDFALYANPSGGSPLWSESHSAVPVQGGLFTVLLGTTKPLAAKDLPGDTLWLETKVNGQQLAPRTPVNSVAYALMADNVVGNITPSSVSVGGKTVINDKGEWVGASTGLQGPQGPPGGPGAQGPAGPQGDPGPVYGCVMRKSCPAGWTSLGSIGIIMPTSTWSVQCPKVGSAGGGYNSSWNWCHPVLCCQNL